MSGADVARCGKCGGYPIDHQGGECVYPRQSGGPATLITALSVDLGTISREYFVWAGADKRKILQVIDRMHADLARLRGLLAETTDRTYTHPDVFRLGVEQGWAEAETDPARIDWAGRQARAAIPFEVADGRPVNPCQKTGIRYGRNEMGFWGENLMADTLVTCTYRGRHLLMIERGDGYGWAVPGGHVEPGETPTSAALRELAEETALDTREFPSANASTMRARYVPDPRASDEAWAVTVPVHVDLGTVSAMAAVNGGDDARRAEWVRADTYDLLAVILDRLYGGRVFAAHEAMLREFLEHGDPS